MGEIGIPRREFLRDITFWETKRIIRGYRKRNRLEQQLLRLTAYMVCFSNNKNEKVEKPHEWLPLPWEVNELDNEEIQSALPTDEEIQMLRQKMIEENKRLQKKSEGH